MEVLEDLRACVPKRQGVARTREAVGMLTRLLEGCRTVGVEEQPGHLVFRLESIEEPRIRVSVVLHSPTHPPLTAAEAAVAEGLVQGLSVAQIARIRGVSANTIKSQIRRLFGKLEVDSRVALVRRLAP